VNSVVSPQVPLTVQLDLKLASSPGLIAQYLEYVKEKCSLHNKN